MNKANSVKILGSVLVASIVLLFTSNFSPLFLFNNSQDPQIYITIGRGMLNGMIPFKDLFDPKGPMMYLFFGIFSFLKVNYQFVGIYILEIIMMTWSIWIVYKICLLYTKNRIAYLLSLFWPVIVVYEKAFWKGGETEELVLPLILSLIYFSLKLINNKFKADFKEFIYMGLLCGCTFWSKFTLIGGWIGLSIGLLIIYISQKRYKELKKAIFGAIIGFLIITIPWIIYFIINHALDDFIWGSFVFTAKYYQTGATLLSKIIYAILHTFIPYLKINIIFCILFILLPYLIVLKGKIIKDWQGKILFILIMLCNGTLEMSAGVMQPYYMLILFPFASLTLAYLGIKLKNIRFNKYTGILCLPLIILLTFIQNKNIYNSIVFDNEIPVQIQFAQKMRSIKGSNFNMLEYKILDDGFYNAANKLPIIKYYDYANMYNANKKFNGFDKQQNETIDNKKVTFVICNSEETFNKNKSRLTKNYRVIDICKQKDQKYYLLQKR